MFANVNICVLNLGFPDVCLVVGVPVPLANINLSTTNIPTVFNVLYGGGMAENLTTVSAVSLGDLGNGVASGMCMSSKMSYLGSFKLLLSCVFASRLTSINGQNGPSPNTVGVSIVPSQFRVIALS